MSGLHQDSRDNETLLQIYKSVVWQFFQNRQNSNWQLAQLKNLRRRIPGKISLQICALSKMPETKKREPLFYYKSIHFPLILSLHLVRYHPSFFRVIFIKKRQKKNKLLNYNTTCFDAVRQYLWVRDKIKNPGKLIVLPNQILTLKPVF